MHPNPAFRKAEATENINFARYRSFGILTVNSENGPLMGHVPFQLSEDGQRLEAHLVRSNPIYRCLNRPTKAVMVVSGPDGYISPDWYGSENQVPTWNYIAVHLRGTLQALPSEDLRGILERLSDTMERRLLPKPIWKIDKISDDALAKMLRQIVPISMEISAIDGTWKLGQNKPTEARLAAGRSVGSTDLGLEAARLGELMLDPPN